MALPAFLSLGELAQPVAALVAPVLWVFSPAFRNRMRRRWAERGRRARIGDVMGWCLAWIFVGLVAALIAVFGR